MNLAEALGYQSDDRLLIVNADDFGLNYSFNRATQQLLSSGSISSSTIMMPCAWAREAAEWSKAHPQYDVGVHFTFTSEWDSYKWGPITRNGNVNSLVTKEGYFFNDCISFEQSATGSQVMMELTNQVEMALKLGLKPTHADNHMGSLYGLATGKHFLLETFDVCAYYGLPFRLPRYVNSHSQHVVTQQYEQQLSLLAQLADMKGVVILDYLVGLPFPDAEGDSVEAYLKELNSLFSSMPSGVTELIIHPSIPSEELLSFHAHPAKRIIEYEVFRSESFQQMLATHQIKLIHWRELQNLQRTQSKRKYTF